jgi:hypothetical protein
MEKLLFRGSLKLNEIKCADVMGWATYEDG